MAKKKNVAEATPAAESKNEVPSETTAAPEVTAATEEPAPEPKPKKERKRKKSYSAETATLADLAAAYLAHMEEAGKSNGTVASYGMELKVAQDELGAETLINGLTVEKVQAFYDCKRVTKLRSGKNKSQLSIDKTRRVLRLALCWAAERGFVEKAPIPEAATT